MAALVGLAALMVAAATPAGAQTITVSGSPSSMTVSDAVAGQELTLVSESSTTWGYTTGGGPLRRVVGRLSASLPPGVELRVSLTAPGGGAQSTGFVLLTTTDQNLITNIPRNTSQSGLAITYRLNVSASAGVIPLSSQIVTFAITN